MCHLIIAAKKTISLAADTIVKEEDMGLFSELHIAWLAARRPIAARPFLALDRGECVAVLETNRIFGSDSE